MAIPVTYSTNLDLADLFHAVSLIASYVLVGIFTFMTLEIFNKKSNLFSFFYIIPAIVFDAFIIIFRWSEEINFFVLIFIVLSVALFICGIVLAYIENKPDREIANEFGLCRAAINRKRRGAIKKLQEALESEVQI